MWHLAVDLGTRSTKAARALDGVAAPIAVAGRPSVPSAVFLHRDGRLLAGWEAYDRGAVAPDHLEEAPRRWLTDGSTLVIGGQARPVVDALAAVLRTVLVDATAGVGSPPSAVALTHPAGWPPGRTAMLEAAAFEAGAGVPRLIPEPIAAVAGALPGLPVGTTVAVYDLGAGTLGTSVVEVAADGLRLLGRPGGHERMGGDVFDRRLLHLVGQRLAAAEPGTWDGLDAGSELRWQRARLSLRQQVRQAREHLSTATLVQVPIPMTGRFVPVGREDLEARIGREVEQAAEALRRTIVEAGVDPARIDHVLVVGGAGRTPLVQWSLLTRFGERVVFAPDPEHTVALGAARILAELQGAPVVADPSPSAVDAAVAGGGPPAATPPTSDPSPPAAGTPPAPPSASVAAAPAPDRSPAARGRTALPVPVVVAAVVVAVVLAVALTAVVVG